MPYQTVVSKTIEYLKVPSVVGHEKFFLDYLLNDFENLGLTVRRHDGLLEVTGRDPKSQIITAHTDRHGLISIGNDQYAYAAQYVKIKKYLEDNKTTVSILKAISERFVGEDVFAYDPVTGDEMGRGTIMTSDINKKSGNAYFSINEMEMEKADIPIAYARNAEEQNGLLKGQIDNVVSLGVIYVLFQNGFQGTALLTTEEEIGKSWLHCKKWLKSNSIETKKLIVLDTSPYREKTPIQENLIVLRNRDKSGEFNSNLVKEIQDRCDKLYLDYQIKDEYFLEQGLSVEQLGSTELGRLVLGTNGKWNGATIQIPTTEYHTSFETTSRGCIDNFYRLLSNILIEEPI